MVRQFKETSIEGKRLLHLGMAACMLLLVMVICHAEPVFAKNFEMDLDANKVTYTLTEAKSGEITFGAANTTGYIYVGKKPDTFVVKNSTDKVIRVGMWVAAESPVTMSWYADFGPALTSQTIGRSATAVITGQTAKPGEEVAIQYAYMEAENKNVKTLPRLQVIAKITVTDDPVYETVINKAPKIDVTKMSADQVGIQVDVNNGGADTNGASKIYVYKGSKKIKTITSKATDIYTFTYKAKGAGSAKYKVKVEMTKNKNDAKTSKLVSPKANVYSVKVSTKLSDYEQNDMLFVTKSLSYSGNTLIVKGYTVNTMGVDLAFPIYTRASYPGKMLFQYETPENKVIKKGIHKYTFKVKNVPVVDLRHCGINFA